MHTQAGRGTRILNLFQAAVVCLFLSRGATAQADIIGVNFVGAEGWLTGGVGPTLADTNIAGYVPQRFWNNAWNDSGSMVLQGDTNGLNPAVYANCTVTWLAGSGDGFNLGQTGNTNTDGNNLLMQGFLLGQEGTSGTLVPTISVTVSNVPDVLTNSGYAVVVYFDESSTLVSQVTLSAALYGTRSVYGLDNGAAFSGSFEQVPSSSTSNLGASTPAGNFAIFPGLTDDHFTLTATPTGYGESAFINGFQIIPLKALPAGPAPVITSPSTATGTVNVGFSYTITASNAATTFGASGLPPGLSVNLDSGFIAGTPTVPGTYLVTLGATNAGGVGTLALNVSIGSGISTQAGTSGTTNALQSGSLRDINNGLAAGANGTLLTTADGGQTWALLNVGLTNALLAVQGLGAYEFIGGSFGLLGWSSDAGQHWAFSNLNLTNTFYSLSLLTPFWGYAVGSGGVACFWDGTQWLPQKAGTTNDLYAVSAVNATNIYAVGDGGTICFCNGNSWTVQNSGTTSVTFYGVSFLNPDLGYAVGSAGAIYQTSDGGATWRALNSGTTQNLRGVWVTDPNTAWAVGDGGEFLQTTDDGMHWTSISLGTTANLNGIQFLNGRGMIWGDEGTVLVFEQSGYTLNLPPMVFILSPTNSTSLTVCSKVRFLVNAYDPDGYLSRVQLFLGTNELVGSRAPHFSFTWTNPTALGTFSCVAKATDNLGASAFSPPLTFTVTMPTNRLAALGLVPTNAFELCVCGVTGQVYAVEVSTNLLDPWTPWRTVTNQAAVTPLLDAGVAGTSQRFYRGGLATDLSLVSAELSNTNPLPGSIVTASIHLTNTACSGTAIAAGDFHIGYYWSSTVAGLSNQAPFYEETVNGCGANAQGRRI